MPYQNPAALRTTLEARLRNEAREQGMELARLLVRGGATHVETTARALKLLRVAPFLRLGTTYTPDDLAELGLRAGLFGDDIPGPIRWATHPVDPLQPLRDLGISEDTVPGLALVLVTEALVGSGRAVRVDHVRPGRVIDGTRRVVVTWTGHNGKQRTVDGTVPGRLGTPWLLLEPAPRHEPGDHAKGIDAATSDGL